MPKAKYEYVFGCLLFKNNLTAEDSEEKRPPHSNSSVYASMEKQEAYLAEKEGREPRPIPEEITFKTREVSAAAYPAKFGLSLKFQRKIEADPFDD